MDPTDGPAPSYWVADVRAPNRRTWTVRKFVIFHVTVVVAYVPAFVVAVGLQRVINIPGMLATTSSEYNTYLGAEVLVFWIAIGWAMYQFLGRRFLGWEKGSGQMQPLPNHTAASRVAVLEQLAADTTWKPFGTWRAVRVDDRELDVDVGDDLIVALGPTQLLILTSGTEPALWYPYANVAIEEDGADRFQLMNPDGSLTLVRVDGPGVTALRNEVATGLNPV